MSNKNRQSRAEIEERQQRVAYRQQKRQLANEPDLSEYKYCDDDGEDGLDDDMLSQLERFLR